MLVRRQLCCAILLFILAACTAAGPSYQRPVGPNTKIKIKGTYYFQPKAAINSFWSSLDWTRVKSDFLGLKANGFNAIIVMIPWGLFQTKITPITYSEELYKKLDDLIALADSAGLKVILRIGSHEYIPEGVSGSNWMLATVLSNDAEWHAYRELFRETASRIAHHRNVLFMFWTFEDVGYLPLNSYHQFPSNRNAFRKWLRKSPAINWTKIWGEPPMDYDQLTAPDETTAPLNINKLRTFLRFSDELLASRFQDACDAVLEGNKSLPLSFQPRPEINFGYDFAVQYALPQCYPFVTTWFSPYQAYLFDDNRKLLDGTSLAKLLPRYLKRISSMSGGRDVFIDQFNFRHFGGPATEAKLSSTIEEKVFVNRALPLVLNQSLGYSIWNYTDYYLNIVSNAHFQHGLAHWLNMGRVNAKVLEVGQDKAIELPSQSMLAQKIGGLYSGKQYTLQVTVAAKDARAGMLGRIQFDGVDQTVVFSEQVGSKPSVFRYTITVPKESCAATISFRPSSFSSSVVIKEVMLYPWIDTGGLYDVDGVQKADLIQIFKKHNAIPPS